MPVPVQFDEQSEGPVLTDAESPQEQQQEDGQMQQPMDQEQGDQGQMMEQGDQDQAMEQGQMEQEQMPQQYPNPNSMGLRSAQPRYVLFYSRTQAHALTHLYSLPFLASCYALCFQI